MTDYSLGRASGKIEIDFDDSGISKAIVDLDKATDSSGKLDKQVAATEKTLQQSDKQFGTSGTAVQGYEQRLKDVEKANRDVAQAEKDYKAVLLDTKSSVDDVKNAHDNLEKSQRRQTDATKAAADAHKALHSELDVLQRISHSVSDAFTALGRNITRMADVSQDAEQKSSALARGLTNVAKAVALVAPEAEGAAGGIELAAKATDKLSSGVAAGGEHVRNFVKDLASFEMTVGKISGLSLAPPSLGGLAGIGGAAGVQGLVEMADAVRQLSGGLGLLPGIVSGVGFSMGTLKLAFHGVDDALKSMMDNDPKKFLQDLQNLGPATAQMMLQIAGFRNQFKLAGAAVQDSFFSKIASDIAPLIQTWLPAITSGMSKVSGIFGDFAHQFAGILEKPATMQAFTAFITNLSTGLQSLQPALGPLTDIFTRLTVVGSSFFSQMGQQITQVLQFFDGIIAKAQASGELQNWIQTGINAFDHLARIVFQVGEAFNNVMSIADKFGGGGLLGFLDKITAEFDKWTQSAEGQKALTDFFSTLRTATDAFIPILKPLLDGLVSIGSAFVQLGVATAPAWVDFFKSFASTMQQLGPQLVGMAPAVNSFLGNLAAMFIRLEQSIGPQLPTIFMNLANAFAALLPQIPQLVELFAHLLDRVGPQLPQLFDDVTQALNDLVPLMPQITGFMRDFVSVITLLVQLGDGIEKTLAQLVDGITAVGNYLIDKLPGELAKLPDLIVDGLKKLPELAEEWGKKLVKGLIDGMLDSAGLGGLNGAANSIVDNIAQWFQKSPAKVGPFSGAGYTMVRGQKMITDMAAGMMSAQPAITSAAAASAAAASGALGTGSGGAGAAGGARAAAAGGAGFEGGSLQPDNIAGADVSILDKYLSHQFDDSRGLKGLAKDMGNLLQGLQSGSNLLFQQGLTPALQGLGMIPGLNQQTWRKMSPEALAQEMQRKSLQAGPQWSDVLDAGAGAPAGAQQTPLNVTAGSSKTQIQQAIIAGGRARGMSDSQIQTALAIAGAESNYGQNPATRMQGGHYVGGLYQQGPAFGTVDQVNDPSYAINAFFNAFAQQLGKTSDPLLAGVLTQNPQLGSGAQGSQYMRDVMAQLAGAGQILSSSPSTWQQMLGPMIGGPGVPIGGVPTPNPDVTPSFPQRVQTGGQPITPAPAPAGGAPVGGLPNLTGAQLPNVRGAHTQLAYALAAIQQLFPSATLNAGKDDHGVDQGWHPRGQAIDIGAPGDNPQTLAAISNWLLQFAPDIEELIHSGPGVTQNIKSGRLGPAIDMPGSVYNSGQAGYHGDHVHLAITDPMAQAFEAALGGGGVLPPGTAAALGNGSLPLPSGRTLGQFFDPNTGKLLDTNQQLLQAYLQGNPALAGQIDAAKTPGASDQQMLGALGGIDSAITGLKAQDPIGNKNTIDALQSQQSSLAQGAGFQQAPSMLQTAQSIAGGASNIVGSVVQTIQGGLDSLAATQDIADRMVYGVRNTEDVNKLIDDVQKYITFAADIANTTGQVLSTIGGIAGAAGSAAGPAGGGAGAALSSAGQIAQLISSVLQGVNAAIDFGQQIYHLAGQYVGRLLSNLVAGPGGTPLMGDVRFLLNKNTGQLISYSQDNPENKNTLNVPNALASYYGYGQGNANPQVNQQWNLFSGPNKSPADMVNETQWLVGTGGTTGALGTKNF